MSHHWELHHHITHLYLSHLRGSQEQLEVPAEQSGPHRRQLLQLPEWTSVRNADASIAFVEQSHSSSKKESAAVGKFKLPFSLTKNCRT